MEERRRAGFLDWIFFGLEGENLDDEGQGHVQIRYRKLNLLILQFLLRELHEYKFVVDSEWRFAPDQPISADTSGNLYNTIDLTKRKIKKKNSKPLEISIIKAELDPKSKSKEKQVEKPNADEEEKKDEIAPQPSESPKQRKPPKLK